jgi:hypothetical protein
MKLNIQQQKIDDSVGQLSWGERVLSSFGPLAGGYLLDLMDLATFGPLGFYLGPLLGGLLGWWLATVYRFGVLGQSILALLTALYCMFPATEFLPLATIVLALVRFSKKQ